jgi:hypothetical protein
MRNLNLAPKITLASKEETKIIKMKQTMIMIIGGKKEKSTTKF